MSVLPSRKYVILVPLLALLAASNAFVFRSWKARKEISRPNPLLFETFPDRDDVSPLHVYGASLTAILRDDPSYGEESRKYRRTVYKAEDWVKHRSTDRFFRNLASTLVSGVVRQLIKEVSVIAGIGVMAVLWNGLLVDGFLDLAGHYHDPYPLPLLSYGESLVPPTYLKLVLPLGPFTLSSPALGLLLVFRTNASYARWLEARSCWGRIVNHSRNIMRMAASWTLNEKDATQPLTIEVRRVALVNLQKAVWAFSRSLQRHLLPAHEDEESFVMDVRHRLELDKAEALIGASHRPNKASFDLANAVDALPILVAKRVEIDKSIVVLADMSGACERTFASPVPLVYTRHTARFLSAWLILLPFALWEPFESSWNHLGMVPASALIAFFLFGIEELAVQLEEPFSILPLKSLVDGIGKSAEEFTDWHFRESSP